MKMIFKTMNQADREASKLLGVAKHRDIVIDPVSFKYWIFLNGYWLPYIHEEKENPERVRDEFNTDRFSGRVVLRPRPARASASALVNGFECSNATIFVTEAK